MTKSAETRGYSAVGRKGQMLLTPMLLTRRPQVIPDYSKISGLLAKEIYKPHDRF